MSLNVRNDKTPQCRKKTGHRFPMPWERAPILEAYDLELLVECLFRLSQMLVSSPFKHLRRLDRLTLFSGRDDGFPVRSMHLNGIRQMEPGHVAIGGDTEPLAPPLTFFFATRIDEKPYVFEWSGEERLGNGFFELCEGRMALRIVLQVETELPFAQIEIQIAIRHRPFEPPCPRAEMAEFEVDPAATETGRFVGNLKSRRHQRDLPELRTESFEQLKRTGVL